MVGNRNQIPWQSVFCFLSVLGRILPDHIIQALDIITGDPVESLAFHDKIKLIVGGGPDIRNAWHHVMVTEPVPTGFTLLDP